MFSERRLFLIRHGETDKNKNKILEDGTYPGSPLNRTGETQAAKTSRALVHDYNFDGNLIVSSDLLRTRQTSHILLTHIDEKYIKIIEKSELREFDYGNLNGEKYKELPISFPEIEKLWVYNPKNNFTFPGSKNTLKKQKTRIINCVTNIIKDIWLPDKKSKDIIFITHGIAIRTIILHFQKAEFKCWSYLDQDNCCINIIKFSYQNFYDGNHLKIPQITIATTNNTNHLINDRYRSY